MAQFEQDDDGTWVMVERPTNVLPSTLRDYFAGQALAGMLAKRDLGYEQAAEWAYEHADAMLKARGTDHG